LSIFSSYILAKVIRDDDYFKFIVSFVFSTCQGVLTLTTWQGTTRALFVVLFPLYLYLLFNYTKSKNKYSIFILIIILFIFLGSVHHLFYFAAIVSILLFVVHAIYLAKDKFPKSPFSIKTMNTYLSPIILLLLFIIMFSIPFFTGTLITSGGRYGGFITFITIYIRYFSFFLLFALGGLFYLIFTNGKTFEDWIIVLILLIFTPFLWDQRYSIWFMLIFLSILTGISFLNSLRIISTNKKLYLPLLAFCLLITIAFSALFQIWIPGESDRNPYNERYIEESTFQSSLWVKTNINKIMTGVGVATESKRISAISGKKILTGAEVSDFIYGFNDINSVKITKISPLSTDFYKENPYIIDRGGEMQSGTYLNELGKQVVDSKFYNQFILEMNVSYAIENQEMYTKFYPSLQNSRNKIYENGKIRFWQLN